MDLYPTRLLCPWDFPGKNTGVGFQFLLQGIFPTQGLNLSLLHCRQILYCLSHWGSPQPWQTPLQTRTWCRGDFLINPGETAEQGILSEGVESLQSSNGSLLQGNWDACVKGAIQHLHQV